MVEFEGQKNLGSEKERWEGEREGREECAFKEFEIDSSSELLRVTQICISNSVVTQGNSELH